MKTVAQQFEDAFEEAQRCKPRSKRRTVLMDRLVKLRVRLMKLEMKKEKRAA